MMTDSTGAVVWAATYDPFGKATITVEQSTNNLRLPGQYFNGETGLHYNYFRDYNPEIGRYVEADPIGLESGINIYAYVANRPTIYADPTGLWIKLRHEEMTFCGAREAGCSYDGAYKLGLDVARVDDRDYSQEPENANWHGMVDGSPGANPAESIRKYFDLQREARHTCDL